MHAVCTIKTPIAALVDKDHLSAQHQNSLGQWSPTFLAPGTSFMEDNFSTDQGRVERVIKAHSIHCAHYCYYYYISSTSDHQALGPGSWGPLF